MIKWNWKLFKRVYPFICDDCKSFLWEMRTICEECGSQNTIRETKKRDYKLRNKYKEI